MRRKETQQKLDAAIRGERWSIGVTLLFLLLAAFAFLWLGYYPGAYEGEKTATVRWSEMDRSWKSNEPITHLRATLSDGVEIYATSPHTPPPVPGDRIVLEVRKNIIGWHSYTWRPDRKPQ